MAVAVVHQHKGAGLDGGCGETPHHPVGRLLRHGSATGTLHEHRLVACGIHHQPGTVALSRCPLHVRVVGVVPDSHGLVLLNTDPVLAAQLTPVPLQTVLIDQAIVQTMVVPFPQEYAGAVPPPVGQQKPQIQLIQLMTPDAVGVRPWLPWIPGGKKGDRKLVPGQRRGHAERCRP